MKNYCSVTLENLVEQSELIQTQLLSLKATVRETTNALLLHENGFPAVTVRVRRFFGEITLLLSYEGDAYNPFAELELWDSESEDYLRELIFRAHKEDLSYSCHNRRNSIIISVHHTGNRAVYATFSTMVAGFLCGLFMKHIPASVAQMVADDVFASVQTIFMNALSLLIAPLVFFSVAESIARLGSGNTGRIGGKTLGFFALCSSIALFVGTLLASAVFSKASGVFAHVQIPVMTEMQGAEISVKAFLLGIVPKNIVVPITSGNMLQILFIALLMGSAMSALGEKVGGLLALLEEAKTLFARVMGLVASCMPVVAFSAMALLSYNNSLQVVFMLLWYVAVIVIGCTLLFLAFSVIVGFLTRCNPIVFIKTVPAFFLTPFVLPKRSAIIPLTLDFCTKRLGVSEKIGVFVLSFGATVNKCAVALCVMVQVILFSHLVGIDLPLASLIKVAVMTFLLSIGNSGLVCLMSVLPVAGIPVNLITLTLGVDDMIDRIRTVTNVSADIAASVVISESEGRIERKT